MCPIYQAVSMHAAIPCELASGSVQHPLSLRAFMLPCYCCSRIIAARLTSCAGAQHLSMFLMFLPSNPFEKLRASTRKKPLAFGLFVPSFYVVVSWLILSKVGCCLVTSCAASLCVSVSHLLCRWLRCSLWARCRKSQTHLLSTTGLLGEQLRLHALVASGALRRHCPPPFAPSGLTWSCSNAFRHFSTVGKLCELHAAVRCTCAIT
jgi:hypothetical protein